MTMMPTTTAPSSAKPRAIPVNTPTRASTTNAPTAMAAALDVWSIRWPANPMQGRQKRDRRQHHQQHADRRCRRQPTHERQGDDEQPEQRDDHGDPGEDDGATRRVDGSDDGLLRFHAGVQLFSVSGDDEQGVVDAHTEADHRRDLGAELGNREAVRGDGHHRRAHTESEQCRGDRQAHRQHRAEGDQQDDDRRQQAEDLALGQVEPGEQLAAVLDAQHARDVRPLRIASEVPCVGWHHRVAEMLDALGQG